MARILMVLITATLFTWCGADAPPTPIAPPPAPACQTNNTAILRFENRSSSNRTYDVFVDNARVATIAPTQLSADHVVVAGVRHIVDFFYTNTAVRACVIDPIPVRCSTQTYFCTF